MREELAAACRRLFELLCAKARVEGRRSRRRGVRLVERALECLDLCASVLGDELPGPKALGWARLGNAPISALERRDDAPSGGLGATRAASFQS